MESFEIDIMDLQKLKTKQKPNKTLSFGVMFFNLDGSIIHWKWSIDTGYLLISNSANNSI